MPEKILQTRIQLKYDTLQNWTTNDPVLKAGEVAVVAIPTDSETTVGQVTKPAIVFKVGDGTSTFTALPYASGLAADVYSWAKQATKPTYTASEVGAAATVHTHTTSQITDFTTAVNALVEAAIADIPSVEIPEYTLRAGTENGTVELLKDGAVVGEAIEIPGFAEVEEAIAGLGALATKDQITNADVADGAAIAVSKIAGLGALATKDTVVEGDISGTIAHTKISGLGSAATANTGDFATAAQGGKADTALQAADIVSGTANGTIAVKGTDVAVKGLGSAAYTASSAYDAAGAATNAVSTHNTSGTAHSDIRALITALQSQVGDLGNALHFVGAGPVADRPQSGAAGDVYVATDEGKEYVYTGTAWEEFGSGDHITKAQADGWYDAKGTAAGLIAGLDVTVSGAGAGKTLATLTETDGKIAATFQDIAITSDQVSGLGALATKDAVAIGEVTGLQDELDSKLESADISNLATKTELSQGLAGKQDTIAGAQLNALNSGITAEKVATYDGYATGKQNALTQAQLNAVNSGITATKVGTYDAYDGRIDTLEAKPGLDKVGTVTNVAAAANSGLRITGTATVAPVVDFDPAVTLVFNCGNASTLVD